MSEGQAIRLWVKGCDPSIAVAKRLRICMRFAYALCMK